MIEIEDIDGQSHSIVAFLIIRVSDSATSENTEIYLNDQAGTFITTAETRASVVEKIRTANEFYLPDPVVTP